MHEYDDIGICYALGHPLEIDVKNIAGEPNSLGPGEIGTFHIIVKDPTITNTAKATYLAQWVGVDSSGSQMLLHPTAEELQPAVTGTGTGTSTPTPDATDTTTSPSTPVASQ